MEIKNTAPPNALIERIMQAGMNININKTVFTYGDTIYNPGGETLPNHLVAHESVHARQQSSMLNGPDAWWEQYLSDPLFRLEQEAEAYAAQYAFYAKNKKSQDARIRFLADLGRMLASQTYGGIISPSQATSLIQTKAAYV